MQKLDALKKQDLKRVISEMRFRSGLSETGLKMTFESFEAMEGKTAALKVSKDWSFESEKGLLLYGPTGSGKTHLACAVLNHSIETGTFGFFLSTTKMPKENTEAIERLSDPDEVPLLVLDDLGAEKTTERALECLYSIIDGRLWNDAPLIVTTNFRPPKELAARFGSEYGERMASRLQQACLLVPVGGVDMRIRR
jgi:DNA replication protein DnaC